MVVVWWWSRLWPRALRVASRAVNVSLKFRCGAHGPLMQDVVDAREAARRVRLLRVRHQPKVETALGQIE